MTQHLLGYNIASGLRTADHGVRGTDYKTRLLWMQPKS